MHKFGAPSSQRLAKAESLAMLRDSLTDGHPDAMGTSSRGDTTERGMAPPPSTLTIAVALRRGRIAATTVLAVATLLALIETFRRGVVLETQLIVLRFLAASLVRPQLSWLVTFAALFLGGIVGFLINNGFNALNVQMIDMDTVPVIITSDLSATTDTNLRTTQPSNPITNTVLRNLVLAREPKALPLCSNSFNVNLRFPDDVVDYGFPQRDWMKQMLPQALDAQTLRVVLYATDERVNRNVSSDKLPMNATRAGDLFMTSVLLSYTYIPWGKQSLWFDDYNATPDSMRPNGRPLVNPDTAIIAGLLPPNGSQATELQQRGWFLRASRSFLSKRPIRTQNLSRSDIVLEFAHVDLSPTITFDAVTWEVELDPETLAEGNTTKSDGTSTRYTRLFTSVCGPWPAICMVPRDATDTPVVIHAFAVCANSDGTETLRSEPRGMSMWNDFVQCPTTSNSSLLVLSATKRLVADALYENQTSNATGLYPATNGSIVATNLRKLYTFTVDRLGWTWQDLATKYGADCPCGKCTGLDFALTGETGPRILVGAESVPLGLVNGPYYDAAFREVDQHPLPIVRVVEPPVLDPSKPQWRLLAGDYLLRHNIGNISWDMTQRKTNQTCEVVQEDRLQLVLNNHLYMETTLQSTYTAAMFSSSRMASSRSQSRSVSSSSSL